MMNQLWSILILNQFVFFQKRLSHELAQRSAVILSWCFISSELQNTNKWNNQMKKIKK